jgi:ankyrin repeat protein
MDKSILTVRDEFGCSALCMAVRHRALAVASWLLQQGADPQTADSFGTTPLMRAATQTTPAMLVLLLSSPRINVNAVDQEQRSALFYAARSNQANAVRTLLGAGASLDVTDSRGYGAMDVAVLANANEAVGVLRELGARQQADVVERSDSIARIDLGRPGVLYRDWPAAALAAARNDVAQLRAQLASPGVLEQRTPQGDTLLHVAYHARAMDALRLLVDAGANASAPDRRGRSMLSLAAGDNSVSTLQLLTAGGHVSRSALPAALDAAVSANAVDTTRLLLGAGASADVVDASGNSMVSVASRLDYVDVVRLLLTSGGNVNAVNRAGRGPLWQAARAGHVNVVVTLLAAHASLEAADYDGNTPLQAAVFSGKPEVVAALLNAGAQTGQLNRNGDTALILAAATGQLDLVNALLARPHRVNTQNRFGDTALIVASRNGHAAVCRTLLKDGASLTLRNGNRLNAVDMARDRGFAQLADELSKAG